jgi:hypothetical protein
MSLFHGLPFPSFIGVFGNFKAIKGKNSDIRGFGICGKFLGRKIHKGTRETCTNIEDTSDQ